MRWCPYVTILLRLPALSIIENGPGSFNGRKIGVLVANGTDAQVLKGIRHAAEKEGAMVELVAPTVGGFEASSGDWIEADHMIDGGPSVLFDAVALVLSDEAADRLTREAAARDFVADAFAHCKFIGFTAGAMPLLAKAGIEPDMDEGLISLDNEKERRNLLHPAASSGCGRGKMPSSSDLAAYN